MHQTNKIHTFSHKDISNVVLLYRLTVLYIFFYSSIKFLINLIKESPVVSGLNL